MSDFPQTTVGGLSMPRLVAGTNWFLGYSHQTRSRSMMINQLLTRERIVEILKVFVANGINAVYGGDPIPQHTRLTEAIRDVQEQTGKEIIRICIPIFPVRKSKDPFGDTEKVLDEYVKMGTRICMPHADTTDALMDKRARCIRDMDVYLKMIRDRGMIPGLSTHSPEAPIYADETGLDVETYVQIYNSAGFLMHVEVDWIHQQIWKRKKPVITIKPLAAGRLQPLEGLAFSWATLRECDLVTVGVMSPDEAIELIEISRAILEKRAPDVELQRTRSKTSVDGK